MKTDKASLHLNNLLGVISPSKKQVGLYAVALNFFTILPPEVTNDSETLNETFLSFAWQLNEDSYVNVTELTGMFRKVEGFKNERSERVVSKLRCDDTRVSSFNDTLKLGKYFGDGLMETVTNEIEHYNQVTPAIRLYIKKWLAEYKGRS